jgi:quinol monooxygenase YgiN
MIKEIARIDIDPAQAKDFEAAVAQAAPHFRAAAGCRNFALERAVDRPGHYLLVIGWESVAAHTVDFRASDGFQAWRTLAGPFFKTIPDVFHVETAIDGF